MAVTLDIDGSVQKINAKLQSTRENLVGVANGYEQIGEASKEAVNGAVRGQDQLASSAKKSGKELKNQQGIIQKLEGHLKRLEQGQKKATSVKEIKKYNTEIAKTRAALGAVGTTGVAGIGSVNTAAKASTGIFRTLRTTLATTFAPLFAAGAAVAGIQSLISTVTEYEQIAADLQAITGANGDTLEFLKQSAVEVGLETTVSAAQTLEAYKLIASAKPELLDNAEGLAEITKEAVSLTEAMGGDLPTTATNLTDIMNQFNAPASEASRFVNALAAGSKEGSADVGQLAASILVAGTEARSNNVAFEESVGLLEVLAENGRKGSEAGTGLRNVLSKLSATDILPKEATARLQAAGVDITTLSDKTLSFTDRLRALAPVQNDANALTAVFGLENKATAQILLENVDQADRLTAAVTNTSVAYEQAATRTATASGEFTKLKNTITSLVIEAGDGLGGLLAFIIRFVRQGLLFFRDRVADLRPAFEPVVAALREFFQVVRNLLPAQEDAAGAATNWGKVVKVLNVPIKILFALLTNGIKIISAVVAGFGNFIKTSPALNAFFKNLRTGISNFLDAFIQLPAFISGGLAAIRTFIVETAKGIGELGRNVSNVLSEAFNIKKLITDGAADLRGAVSDLLTNPFEGVGTKASGAFTEEFNKAQEPVEIPAKVVPLKNVNAPSTDGTPSSDIPAAAAPFVDPEKAAKEAEKRAKEAEKRAKEEERRAQDIARAKLDAMRDGVEKELALEEARFTDLIAKLEEYGIDSTDAVFQNELNKFQIKSKFLSDAADLEGLSGEERINFLFQQTKAELDAIESALKENNGGELVRGQAAQLNLLRQKATEDYLKQLEELQSKELQAAQQHEINLLELRAGEFETAKEFEQFKQEEILKIRLKFAEKQLAILEKTKGAEDDAALALRGTINGIRAELKGLAAAGNTASDFNIFSLIGLDPNDPQNKELIKGIETAAATTIDVLRQVNEVRLQSAEQAIKDKDEEINAIQERIEAKESELDEQEALAEKGFANNAEQVRQEIALLQQQQAAEKAEREKALNEKKKIQRQQAIIDTVTQASSLITAAAQVFQSVAAIPFAGPIIGAALVAAMIGSFVAAKTKVFQNINKQKAERGMTGTVKGRRHSQGGERFGDHIEVEDGEAFGVLSRGATRSFGSAYEAFTNAANKGDRRTMAAIASSLAGGKKIDRSVAKKLEGKEAKVIQLQTEVNASLQSQELKENNKLLRAMLKNQSKTKRSVEYTGDRKIDRIGNNTRIIKRRKHG